MPETENTLTETPIDIYAYSAAQFEIEEHYHQYCGIGLPEHS